MTSDTQTGNYLPILESLVGATGKTERFIISFNVTSKGRCKGYDGFVSVDRM